MVAIGTGMGVGLERNSASLIGARGQIGSVSTGRGGDGAFVNAANGNLVITRQDEFLVGLGPDVAISRTYNSQATVGDGDNNDQWRMSAYRRIIGANGTANVTRVDWDGSETVYFQYAANSYATLDGAGAHDWMTWTGTEWNWTDAGSQTKESYDSSGKLLFTRDLDGNTLSYAYVGSLLASITDQNGERTDFVYGGAGGAQLQQVTTVAGSSSVRVRYTYDGSNRLSTVTVDLSPEDGSTADGKTYVTTYTYDGASKRVASIAQSDGSLLQIGYAYSGADYRVVSLTETVAAGVTRVTGIYYDVPNRVTRITDPAGGVTTMSYDAKGNLTQIVLPVPSPGAAAPTIAYTYAASGDLLSMTENGQRTDYEYDAAGNLTLSRDPAGNTAVRTYGSMSQLLTSTVYLVPDPDGAGAGVAATPVTTRYAYDGENHLRFGVSSEGAVTEYRYDRYGRRVSVIVYKDAAYNLSGLATSDSISEATLNAWVSALANKSTAQRTDTFYDFRGNVASEASYESLSVFGEAPNGPLAVAPGANTTVTHQSDGLFRVAKTSGANLAWDADAHSSFKSEGDFTLRLRPVQSNQHMVGGVSSAPGNSASYQNPDYGLYFIDNGVVYYMENGVHLSLNTTYVAGDNFWLTRVGNTISYYKGATLAAAMAAGPLRTRAGSTGALYFDSSFYGVGAALDVEFTSQAIVNGVNTSVVQQPDGMVRITKTGGGGWDADARGTARADGDFAVHMKAVSTDNWVIAGVSRNPAASAAYNTVDFSFYFAQGNQLWAIENEGYALLGSYKSGEDFWLTRVGNTVNYYRGATLEAAVAAGTLRTVGGVTGSFYFDSSILVAGGAVDVDFMPSPIVNGVNTVVTQGPDGLLRVTKTGANAWDGDARSTTRAAGDFVLQMRPGQTDKYVMGGVSAVPGASASYETVDYCLYFLPGGGVQCYESGAGVSLATSYAAGDRFWIVRSGSTISYYKGATLDAAKSAGALRTRTGVSGTFAFDSAFHSSGAILDVSFNSSVEVSRTNYVYSPTGQLLSRINGGSTAQEIFAYDGLGRLVSGTDMANATTTFLFNDSASTTTATLASGLTRVAVYNKAGELISVTESGANVPTGVTNYYYDGLGRLRMETNPNGAATYHVYDNASRKVADITTDGSMTEYSYDASGRPVRTIGYINKLTAAQIALLDDFTAGGAGGSAAGAQGIGGAPTGSNLVVNGGFDTSAAGYTQLANNGRANLTLPGWIKINSEAYEQVSSGVGGVTASEGNFWLDMDSVAGSGAVLPIGSNLVLNPSFETSAASFTSYSWGRSSTTLPNWVKANGEEFEQVATGNYGIAASNGTYWLELDSIPSVRSTIGNNLLLNPSFDTIEAGAATTGTGYSSSTLTGWTKANSEKFEQVTSGALGVTASNGGYWLDLDSVAGTGTYLATGANLLTNGSFDTSAAGYTTISTGRSSSTLPGWTKTNSENFEQATSGSQGITGTDGAFWLDLDSVPSVDIPYGASLLVNGSFDTSAATYTTTSTGRASDTLPGWTNLTSYQFEQVAAGQMGVTGTDGAYWLDLDSVPVTVVPPNLIVNGSFEQSAASYTTTATGRMNSGSIPGWTGGFFEQTNSGTNGVAATDGSFILDSDSGSANMDISQTIANLAAGAHTLKFDFANVAGFVGDEWDSSGALQVYWNGVLIATVGTTETALTTKSFTVNAVNGNNILRFKEIGIRDGLGVYLDNVRLTSNSTVAGGNMNIAQTVAGLTAGERLQLSFSFANRSPSGTSSFVMYWNEQAFWSSGTGTSTNLQNFTFPLNAIAGNNTLRIQGFGTPDGVGVSLDNLSLKRAGQTANGGNMDIYQTVANLAAGQVMKLQFNHANTTTAASGSFDVLWNDVVVAQYNSINKAMVTESLNLTAIAGTNKLRFRATGTVDAQGAAIDNVRLFATTYDPNGGNMDISQTVSGLTAGQIMRLQFDHANRTTAASGSFDVYWNGGLVAQITSTGTTMLSKSYDVTALAGNNTLRFVGAGAVDASGASLDNVRLFATQTTPHGGNMDISQAISGLTAGQTYQFQFDHANRTTAASGSFDVYWNTTRIAQITSTGTTMTPESYFVVAAAGANTIRFVGTGTVDTAGAAIDNVRLFATQTDVGGGNMDFSQTIPNLAAGQAMLLQFDHANRTTAASGSFNVYWNGALVAQVNSTGTTMVTENLNVTAVAGNNVLRFLGTGAVDAVGASIDNVRLFATQSTSGGGGAVTDALAGLRPVAHADDRYGWSIYDSASRLIETIDGSGGVTVLTYDGASRLIETRGYATQLAAATVTAYKSVTPTVLTAPGADAANDRVARSFYRKDGLLLGTLDGEGYLSENVYDGAGVLIETIGYATATVAGNRAAGSFATLKAGVTAPVNGKDVHHWYVHDGRGLLRGEINGEGDLTRYHYTALGDVDQKVRGQKLDPAALIASRPTFASLPTAAGGQITETTSYTRDPAGKVMSEARLLADGTSWTTLYGYDSAGRLTSRTEAAGTGDARTFTQRYDARGNLIGELGGEGSAALAALGSNPAAAAVDNVYATWGTIYRYDAGDRLTSKTESNGVNALGNRTVYFYRNQLLAFEMNALGEVIEYRYNARGERTDTVAYANRVAAATVAGVWGGEVSGDVQAVANSLVNAAYDSVTHVDYNVTGTVKQSIDPLSNTVNYGYNAFGELKTRTNPIDASTSVQTDRLYDRRGLLISEKRDAAAGGLQLETLYGYDAFGQPLQVTDPAGRVRKTDYDRAGRLAVTTDARNATQIFGYDGRGNVLSIINQNNTVTTFTYDAFSRTLTSTTPGLITTTIKHNAHGQTVSIKDGALRETTYAYDKDGNLRFETDAVSQVERVYDSAGRHKETIDARGSKASFTYDAANRILTEKVNDGGLNLVTAYEYDSKGQRVRITDPANRVTVIEFDQAGRQIGVVVDSAGFAIRTQYDYDKSGRVLFVTEAVGAAAARVTQYEYDKADRLLRSRVDPSGLNLLTQFSYDKAGNVARKTDAANFVTTYAYDAENRLTHSLDPEGGVVETFYDNEGRVSGLRRYANPGSATAAAGGAFTISVTPDNGRDQVSAFFYDADGRLKVSIDKVTADGAGRPTEHVYDNARNVLRSIDYAGTIAFAIGESLGTIQGRTAALANLADNRITRAVYDGANRRAYSIDATGQVTAFGYDGGGNVIKQVRYAVLLTATNDPSFADMGVWASTNAHADDRVDRTFYDGASRATFSVDAENYVTQYQYDGAGRVTKHIRHASKTYSTGDGVSEAALAAQIGAPQSSAAVTAFAYDSAGRLTDTTNPENSVTHLVLDSLGQATDTIAAYNVPGDSSTTHRVFDKAGRVQSETRAYGTPDASTTSYIYDGVGRLRKATDPYNVVTEYIYDGMGRCIHEIQPLNAGETAHTYKEYDKFGNLAKLTDPRGNSAVFHYDALDRLVWQTDPEGYVTKTTYSRGDEVASVTRYAAAVSGTTVAAPPAVVVNASVDSTTTFDRDKLDRIKSVTDGELKTEYYTLNAFGDRISVKNKIDGTTNNIFDKRGLLTWETLPVGSTRADGSLAAANVVNKYDYDARGNRIKTTEAYGIVGEERVTDFVYDKADRLKQKIGQQVLVLSSPTGTAAATTPTETYNYDARGNLIETAASWGARTLSYYDDHNRKVAEIQATSSTHGTLSKWDYDLNGNIKAGRIYADPFLLPGTAGGAAPNSASAYRETLYDYDANNRRIRSKVVGLQSGEYGSAYVVGDIILETVYDLAGNIVQEKDGRNNSLYFYYDRANRKIAQVDQERYLTFYTLDTEGNVKIEERFANQVASPNINSIPADMRASVAGGAGNRVTYFEYDRNGRRTAETRMGVNGKKLSAIGQLEAAHSPDARIAYEYNGLGQVIRKTEANLDFTIFQYDLLGRQTAVQSATYLDFQNNEVSQRTETTYNGLGAVTRSVAKSRTGAADRVTTYTYGAGGRLSEMKDAADFVRAYSYDAAGNVVREAYSRANSAGIATAEANAYRYDLLNRVTSQSMLTQPAGSWVEGVVTRIRYNSFGEMTGRGLNADANGAAYQETFDYDAGGRMWRSTAGDGSVRLYGHDKAGNANLVITSASTVDLANLSLASAISTYGAGGTSVATTATIFDGRGQATTTHELQRQVAEGAATQLITTKRTYNAFGEVRQETDAFNRNTDYGYNTAGKLTKRELPTASYTTETSAVVTGTRATENYSYDLSGRLIGIEDAYGNDTTRRLLAGTGYGDEEVVVLAEYHPDDGVATKAVDEFGDVRTSTDEILRVTGYTYDKMGRLTELAHAGGLTDSYRYDGLGQRTQHWNSFFGGGVVDRTDYDNQGRVTQFVQASGTADAVTVSTAYTWDPNRSTNGLGTFGGWVKTTTHGGRTNNNQSVQVTDYFGHIVDKTDLGGRTYAFTYDKAGRVTQQTSSASQNLAFTYFNTGKAATITDSYVNAQYSPNSVQATFAYDLAGNRTFEGYSKTSYQYDWYTGYTTPFTQSLQAATVTYDELGRMKTFDDTANPVSIDWEYDQVGNVRRVLTTFTPVGLASWMDQSQQTTDRWYTYDSMNRMVQVMGYMAGGQIGNDISTVGSGFVQYDKAGQRKSLTTNTMDANFSFGKMREEYIYTAAGQLDYVTQSTAWYYDIMDPNSLGPYSAPVLIADNTRDVLGRLTGHSEYANGVSVYSQSSVYNYLSQVTLESTFTKMQDGSTTTTSTSFDYQLAGQYQGGVVTSASNSRYNSFSGQTTSQTTNSYVWWDEAKISTTTSTSGTTASSVYSYDENGKLASVSISGNRARTVQFVTDLNGQVMSRTEYSTATDNPKDIYYYFNGLRVGDLGNHGPSDTDYSMAIAKRGAPAQNQAFDNEYNMPSIHADFDQAFSPIGPGSEGGSHGGYVAREGDTLRTIALAVWGDADMWYLIGEANGLSAGAILTAGQRVRIPAKVTNIHNNSETFRVYDPNKAIGDNSPSQVAQAKPSARRGGCGMIGTIILIAVAVAITLIIKAPVIGLVSGLLQGTALAGAATVIGAAATGAIASVVSQGVGLVTGIQEKFSWKGVAMSALSAGITQGVGGGPLIQGAGKFANDVARGALISAATQGVAVATGLQKKFDWAGIAVAGVVSGVSGAIGRALPSAAPRSVASHVNDFVSRLGGAVAGAATRSVITGTSFGDNVLGVLPDVIGTTIGNLIGEAIVGGPPRQARPDRTDEDAYEGDGIVSPFEDPATELPAYDGDGYITAGEMTPFEEFEARMAAIGVTLEPADRKNPLMYALSDEIPLEIKRKLWDLYQNNEIEFDRRVARLPGRAGQYDERRGPNGVLQFDEVLLRLTGHDRLGSDFGAMMMWADFEEQGHQLDAMAWAMMGRPGGDSPGDEGGMFAYLQVRGMDPAQRGVISYNLGSLASFNVDTVTLRLVAQNELASGALGRENRLNGVEYFGPAGHYHTTFVVAFDTLQTLGRSRRQAYGIAQELAFGSQLPDMVDSLDATSLFFSWTSPSEMRRKHSAFHSLPMSNAGAMDMPRIRGEIGREVTGHIAAGRWADAGLAIHALADSYSHTHMERIGGRWVEVGYQAGVGHGLAEEGGHGPDNIFRNNWNRSKTLSYVRDLGGRLIDGFVGPTSPARRQQLVNAVTSDWMTLYRMSRNENDMIRLARNYENHQFNMPGGNIGLAAPLPLSQMDVGGNRVPPRYERPIRDRMRHVK